MSAFFSSHQTPIAIQSADLLPGLLSSSENVPAINPDGSTPVIGEVHLDHGDQDSDRTTKLKKLRDFMARCARAREEEEKAERERPCPNCGAREEHQKERRSIPDWLGLGETEFCELCGADHEHWSAECKRPLSERSLMILLQMARDVEWAYTAINRPMTKEQIILNREYLRRIVEAVLSSNMYHIENRVEQCEAEKRLEELRGEAAELFGKLHGNNAARRFYKDSSRQYSERELVSMIDELRRDLGQAEPA